MKKKLFYSVLWTLVGSCLLVNCASVSNTKTKESSAKAAKKLEQPNIIFILADDLGYGDLSCYGQQKFATPNIDRLAQRGMKFYQHYSGSTVCAPSRSSLMTGQHTGHTPIRGNRELPSEGQTPLPAESVTIAEILKKAGYTTGAFGKWGLGFINTEGDPLNQGFDTFYGYNCQRVAHRYYPEYLWHNKEKAYLKGNDWTNTVTYAPTEIQKKTLAFIEDNHQKPFFAYVPLVQPHAELIAPNDEVFAQFEGKFPEKPYPGKGKGTDYGADLIVKKYTSQAQPRAVFATMVTHIDNYVGEIVDKLEALNLMDNTIIIFASDNGPHAAGGADPEFFNSNGALKGIKRDLYEGGIRTPLIVTWEGKIAPNSESNHVSAFWDFMPTIADLVKQSSAKSTDGISFLPTLLGENTQIQHEYLYWEFPSRKGRVAVRYGNWKGVLYNRNSPKRKFELFDLSKDEGETNDVSADYPEIVAKIKAIMQEAHSPSSLFPLEKS